MSAVTAIPRTLPLWVLLTLLLAGCSGDSSDPDTRAENLAFNITDSLLADTCYLPSAAIFLRTPRDFLPMADSTLDSVRLLFAQGAVMYLHRHLERFFLNDSRQSAMAVFSIDSSLLRPDRATFSETYASALKDRFGVENVTYGDFRVNGLLVTNYMITDSNVVRIHLLAAPPGYSAAEIQYVVPRSEYPSLLKSLESSIGTLTLKTEGAL